MLGRSKRTATTTSSSAPQRLLLKILRMAHRLTLKFKGAYKLIYAQLFFLICVFSNHSVAGRMLTLVNFSSVTLDGLWITGFMNYGNGGAIYAENSSLTVRNCFFINNSVFNIGSGASGAALFAKNSNVYVENTVFYSHKSKADGGVIYAGHSSNLTVTDSRFEDAICDGQGGFIFFDATHSSSMFVSSTKFFQASAYAGGAIAIYGGRSNPTANMIMTSTFAGLSTSTTAASILLQGASLTMQLCSFINNFAISGASALEAYSSSIKLTSNTFNFTGAPEATIVSSTLADTGSYFGNGGQ